MIDMHACERTISLDRTLFDVGAATHARWHVDLRSALALALFCDLVNVLALPFPIKLVLRSRFDVFLFTQCGVVRIASTDVSWHWRFEELEGLDHQLLFFVSVRGVRLPFKWFCVINPRNPFP